MGRALIGGAGDSGSVAMLAAMRRASSRVSSLAPDWRSALSRMILGASQSVCGGPSSSLSLAVNIAIRNSASARLRFGLNASSS